MKKMIAAMCSMALAFLLAAPVYASGADVDIADGGADDGAAAVVEQQDGQPTATGTEARPVSVKIETVGDVPYITKTYELAPGDDLTGYVAGFEQDGFAFTRYDIYEQLLPDVVESRTVTQAITADAESNSKTAVLAAVASAIAYNEDGYSGQLALDATTVVVEPCGEESYTYRITDVREYNALDRNDAAYIDKTVLKNGVTLQLESIEWVVMGTYPVDGRMVPSLFKAIATYSGSASGTRTSGYVASFAYTGTVERVTQGGRMVQVVFRGEPVAVETTRPVWPIIALGVVCVGLAGLLVAKGVRHFVKGRKDKQDISMQDFFGEGFDEQED